MSKIIDVKLNCPECGAEGEFTLWESVNKQLSPESAEKVKSGEIFKWTCPKCGKTFTVPYSMLYHDMDIPLMIYLLTNQLDLSKSAFGREAMFQKDYTYRAVYDIDDLREKISIFEDGLDDRGVELVKYVYTHQQKPQEIPDGTLLRYVGKIEGKGMLLQCIHPDIKENRTMIIPFEMYDNMVSDGLHEQVFGIQDGFSQVTQDYLCSIMDKH